jgi:hypothetical protein
VSLPSCVVATWVGVIELESTNFIPAGVHESNTERSAGTKLSIMMLLIAKELDELLNINWLVLRVKISLTMDSSIIYEVVCISYNAGNSAENMLINLVKFSRFLCWHEKLGSLLLLGSKDNAIFGEDTDNGTILVDMLDGVFNLEQTTVWVEGSSSFIVLIGLSFEKLVKRISDFKYLPLKN